MFVKSMEEQQYNRSIRLEWVVGMFKNENLDYAQLCSGEQQAYGKTAEEWQMLYNAMGPLHVAVNGLNPENVYLDKCCLLYTSPSPRDQRGSRMPSSA